MCVVRLLDMELIGAKVAIHQCTKPVLVGVEGVIVAQSAAMFHIFHNKYTAAAGPPSHRIKVNAQYLASHKVIKVRKDEVTLAIHLPEKKKRREAGSQKDTPDEDDEASDDEAFAAAAHSEATEIANDHHINGDAQPLLFPPMDEDESSSFRCWIDQIGSNSEFSKIMLIYGKCFAPSFATSVQ